MASYLYGCENKEHQTVEVSHSMFDNPVIPCSTCGKPLHRIPQPFRFGWSARLTLLDKIDREYNPATGTKRRKRNAY